MLLFIASMPFGNIYTQVSVIDSLKARLPKTQGEEHIKTLIGISYNFFRISEDSSIYYSQRALDYSNETNNRRGVARAFLMLGNGYSAKGNTSLALTNHRQSYDIFAELGDTSALGIVANSLGADYHNLGRYSEAISQYQNSLSISKNLENKWGMFFSTNNIGIVNEEWGKLKLALEYYLQALEIAEELKDDSNIGITLQNIGVAHMKLGNYDEALDFLERSLTVNQKIGASKGIFNTFINKGDVFQKSGKTEEAVNSFKLALQISEESENKQNIARSSLRLGVIYTETNQFNLAKNHLDVAISISRELEEVSLKKEIFQALSDYYYAVNDFKNAYLSYIDYTTLKDTIFNRDSRGELQEMQTLYELDKKEKEIEIKNLKIDKQQARFYYIISGVFVLLVLVYLLFNRYTLKQKQVRTELEKKNIDIEQRLLRTQMNPHFIFNSLNSINSFISDNKADDAQSFLAKFARLMRYILDNSRKTFVPIEDEVNTLELNMELERLRFDNKFDFSVELDENIDTEYTFIPPMLIQPFIENAILHGLSNKAGKGQLSITFKQNGELMHCTIEDNGVGRQNAQEFKTKSGKGLHKSLGMQVTRERLEILNERTKEEVTFSIIDLSDDMGNPTGTKVELHIPYEVE